MLGMASIEYHEIKQVYYGAGTQRVIWNITGTSSGTITGSVEGCGATTKEIEGTLKRIAVFPHKTLVPTDNFDLYLYDLNASVDDIGGVRQFGSLDILGGHGVDTDSAAPSQYCLASEPMLCGKVSLVAYNMGTGYKRAKVIAYIKK